MLWVKAFMENIFVWGHCCIGMKRFHSKPWYNSKRLVLPFQFLIIIKRGHGYLQRLTIHSWLPVAILQLWTFSCLPNMNWVFFQTDDLLHFGLSSSQQLRFWALQTQTLINRFQRGIFWKRNPYLTIQTDKWLYTLNTDSSIPILAIYLSYRIKAIYPF